jgi:hypothetical protein
VHKHYLYYHDVGVDESENPPHSSMDLLHLTKIEIVSSKKSSKKGYDVLMLHIGERKCVVNNEYCLSEMIGTT